MIISVFCMPGSAFPHCPNCGREISRQTVDQMVDQLMALPERTRIQLLAPVVRGRKGRHEKVLEQAEKSGYVRVMVDGNQYDLSEKRSRWRRTSSTTSRSWWTVWWSGPASRNV